MTDKEKDRKWSKEVKKRDGSRCRFALPGCTGKGTDACHIFSRRFRELRWNLDNGLTGCRSCHTWLEQNSHKAEKLSRQIVGELVWKCLARVLEEVYKIRKL